jgi:GNAT superfamily N-acetyltransferase
VVAAVGGMTLDVRRATVAEIFPLRHTVLRPGRPESASVYREDDSAVHISAWEDGALVGCATVFPDPWQGSDDRPAEETAWRLRGMAVDPSRHRTGVGREILAAVVAAAVAGGAPLLWANARTAALAFYEANGWVVAGEEYITADTGLPHKPIVLVPSVRPGA